MKPHLRALVALFSLLLGSVAFPDVRSDKAEAGPEIGSLLVEMEQLLGSDTACPVGEATTSPEWTVCLERWEKFKTEELYLPRRPNRRAEAPSANESPSSSEAPVHQ